MNHVQMNAARRRRMLLVAGGLLAIIVLVLATISISSSSTTAGAAQKQDGTPTKPLTGANDDQPAVLPSQVDSWLDVVRVGEAPATSWYQDCVTRRLDVSWNTVQQAAILEKAGWVTQGVLVSNTLVSDPKAARDMLAAQLHVKVDPRAPVIGVDGFDNTRGLDGDRCNGFNDPRSQVRLTLLLPGFTKESPQLDRGILFHCGNPWKKNHPGSPGGGGGGVCQYACGRKPGCKYNCYPTTTTTTRPRGKCDGAANSFGGKTYCGTPASGPEQQPVQENDPGLVAPTPGYTPGGAEQPHPGTDSGGGGGSSPPGGTTNPDGSVTPGTGAGTSNPQDTNGNNDPTPNSGDPGAPA